MNRVLAYLGRFTAMIFGFIVAVLVASVTINLLLLAAMERPTPEISDAVVTATLINIPVVAAFVGYASFFPALLVMFVAEFTGMRDWLFHAIGGGSVALFIMAAHWVLGDNGDRQPDISFAAVIVAAGLLAGLAYWLIAGRRAGVMMDRQAEKPNDSRPSGS